METGPGQRGLALPAEQLALVLQALSLGLALELLADPEALTAGLAGELGATLIDALSPHPDRRDRAHDGS